jgi:hypothetical protein
MDRRGFLLTALATTLTAPLAAEELQGTQATWTA